MATQILTAQQAAFLRFELDSGDPRRQKTALQDICRLYRLGLRFSPEARLAFEQAIAGITVNSRDEKVVRWGLNTIARLGTMGNTAQSVEYALKRHEDKPEIVAAAISALGFLYKGQIPALEGMNNILPAVRMLAAMQTVAPTMLDKVELSIDIDSANEEILKLALIVVGINRDIQHLLHPHYENGEIVRALGQHDDHIVRQYSVWAVIENKRLTLDHLGTSFDTLELEPPNVQSKLLQLGASRFSDFSKRQDLIIRGSNLTSTDAREGLSKGLLNSFYDGLQDVTLSWFETEESPRVQLLLAEHFARYSDAVPSYRDMALSLHDRGGEFRERVLLGAERMPLYGEIKAREAASSFELFGASTDEAHSKILMAVKMQNATTVLVLNATPDDQGRLRADKEAALLEEQLRKLTNRRRDLNVVQRFAVRLDQVQEHLLNHEPKILHFSGHGDRGILVFETHDGSTAVLDGDVLADILDTYGKLECVILHACFTEEVAQACARYVPVVVGSTDTINDLTAPKFTYAFYQALANGRDYENAFRMGKNEVATVDRKESEKYKILK